MKTSEIKVGRTYTDGKGAIRLVTGEGRLFKLYQGQASTDCLQYKLLAKKRGPHPVGSVCNSTRAAFASWAKEEVL